MEPRAAHPGDVMGRCLPTTARTPQGMHGGQGLYPTRFVCRVDAGCPLWARGSPLCCRSLGSFVLAACPPALPTASGDGKLCLLLHYQLATTAIKTPIANKVNFPFIGANPIDNWYISAPLFTFLCDIYSIISIWKSCLNIFKVFWCLIDIS